MIAPVDPLGGSYYVESLTAEIEGAVCTPRLAEIDRRGGTRPPSGRVPAGGDADAAYARSAPSNRRSGSVVGVNAFAEDGDEQRPQPGIDPQAEAEQVARTRAVRAGRDADRVAETTEALEAAATGTENVVPRIRACVEAGVTLGEINAALRGVWGEYRP